VDGLTFRPLYLRGKIPTYSLDGLQNRSESGGEEKNVCICRELNPGRPALIVATVLIEPWHYNFLVNGNKRPIQIDSYH
jgi:hypothetical protein